MKDQIYFMQTETPEYKVNKQAGVAASKVWGHSLIDLDIVSVWGNFLQLLLLYIMGEGKVLMGTIRKYLGIIIGLPIKKNCHVEEFTILSYHLQHLID